MNGAIDMTMSDGAHKMRMKRVMHGQWIAADDPKIPMVLSGWVVHGDNQEYDGTMTRGSETREADDAQVPDKNGVVADGGQ